MLVCGVAPDDTQAVLRTVERLKTPNRRDLHRWIGVVLMDLVLLNSADRQNQIGNVP